MGLLVSNAQTDILDHIAYITVLGKIHLQGFSIVFKPKRRHSKEDIFTVDRLSLFLLALLRS